MNQDEAYYKQVCFLEFREILDQVSDNLLKVETDPSDAMLLNSIFRGIHTIKGSAGMFDMEVISNTAHQFEALLKELREGKITITPEMVDVMFQAVDVLNSLLKDYESGVTPQPDDKLGPRLSLFTSSALSLPIASTEASTASSQESEEAITLSNPLVLKGLSSLTDKGFHTYLVRLKYSSEMLKNGYDPLIYLGNLKSACEYYYPINKYTIPEPEEFNPLILYIHTNVLIASNLTPPEIADIAFDPELIEVELFDPQYVRITTTSSDEQIDEDGLKEFLIECSDLLDKLEKGLIAYDNSEDHKALDDIFRVVHTIKGDAAYIGLGMLGDFSHQFEDLLAGIRCGKIARSKQFIDLLFKSLDNLKISIELLNQGKRELHLESICKEIQLFLVKSLEKTPECREIPNEMITVFLNQAEQHKKILTSFMCDDITNDPEKLKVVRRSLTDLQRSAELLRLRNLVEMVQKALQSTEKESDNNISKLIDTIVSYISSLTEGSTKRLGEILIDEGIISIPEINNVLTKQKPIGELLVEENKITQEDLDSALRKQMIMKAAASQKLESSATSEIRVMRVDESKIDVFTNMIGELIVAKNAYDYLIDLFSLTPGIKPGMIKSLKDNIHLFSRISNDLQTGIMAIRMIPIKGIFQKFSRVVRDISRKQNKRIDFITEGEETEVDKKIADIISDPLIHMIRNSCDHGIETPSERINAGKPENGTIMLRAYQAGSKLFIKVSDDGRGINRQNVYNKAKNMSLTVNSINDENLLDVIFLPGFSLAKEVTDLSGRGVGMDVVRSTIVSLGGAISLISDEGKGSEITLEIPMTMGICMALVVEADEGIYAIPLEHVIKTIKLLPEDICRIHDRLGIHYRGEIIPLERLGKLLNTGAKSGAGVSFLTENDLKSYNNINMSTDGEEISIVILNTGRGKLGVIVDRLVRNMEIAIKPVPDALTSVELLSGISILGDGKILLVINPEKLV